MQLAGMTARDIKANIHDAEARVRAALAEYEAAKAELAWWQEGLRLIDPQAAAALNAEPEIVTELFPDGVVFATGARPTLRQAIVLVMREAPGKTAWTINELASALDEHDWLPAREDANKGVSDMVAAMYNAGQLSRLDRGVYKLAPPLEAALGAAYPVTDYEVAARHGFPAPDHAPRRKK